MERVSEEILKQLLDALESDNVFNKLEREEILQKNTTRADKARCFIDCVRNKGDEACRKMMKHLQTKDSTLSSQLGLPSGLSAEEGKVPYKVHFQKCQVVF